MTNICYRPIPLGRCHLVFILLFIYFSLFSQNNNPSDLLILQKKITILSKKTELGLLHFKQSINKNIKIRFEPNFFLNDTINYYKFKIQIFDSSGNNYNMTPLLIWDAKRIDRRSSLSSKVKLKNKKHFIEIYFPICILIKNGKSGCIVGYQLIRAGILLRSFMHKTKKVKWLTVIPYY